ncbi:hypothetical protein LJC42_02365 [Eubacteriales bacterium OttesenSCG-928-K08]|nr:hypothetical protein [Eubacteriales bacterium OttesenSCG-928-K08]
MPILLFMIAILTYIANQALFSGGKVLFSMRSTLIKEKAVPLLFLLLTFLIGFFMFSDEHRGWGIACCVVGTAGLLITLEAYRKKGKAVLENGISTGIFYIPLKQIYSYGIVEAEDHLLVVLHVAPGTGVAATRSFKIDFSEREEFESLIKEYAETVDSDMLQAYFDDIGVPGEKPEPPKESEE